MKKPKQKERWRVRFVKWLLEKVIEKFLSNYHLAKKRPRDRAKKRQGVAE